MRTAGAQAVDAVNMPRRPCPGGRVLSPSTACAWRARWCRRAAAVSGIPG